MSIREKPTYLSHDVWRALWLLSKSKEDISWTPDRLADEIIRETLLKTYPQLFEHQKQLEKLDKELIKSLTK